ncbi:gem-associated protein 8-like [Argonauta hians]
MKRKMSRKNRKSNKPKSNPNLNQSQNWFQNWGHSNMSSSWYTHEYFSKYWQYYNYSKLWYRNHLYYTRNASQNTAAAATAPTWPVNNMTGTNYGPFPPGPFSPWSPMQQVPPSSYGQKKPHRKPKKRQRKFSSSSDTSAITTTATSEEPDDNADDVEMKVPEGLLEFMLASKKFREEREALKQEQNQKDEELCVNIGDVVEHVGVPSSLPPSECPGSQRTLEIKQLYGKKATLIHGMETALQMNYDQMIDLKQPKMWPNMPLKPVFN